MALKLDFIENVKIGVLTVARGRVQLNLQLANWSTSTQLFTSKLFEYPAIKIQSHSQTHLETNVQI